MKSIAYSVIVYFVFASAFKYLGDFKNNVWVNYYWLFSSAFLGFIFLKLRSFCDIGYFKNKYKKRDIKLYKAAITAKAIYWGVVMLVLRIYVAINIELYDKLISSARTLTVGGVTIVLIFIFVFYKTTKKNDR